MSRRAQEPFRSPCRARQPRSLQRTCRATGYISERNVDIADRVRAGALLAQLAVPGLDDQIWRDEATLDQVKSAFD
jgi:hypothetical protein